MFDSVDFRLRLRAISKWFLVPFSFSQFLGFVRTFQTKYQSRIKQHANTISDPRNGCNRCRITALHSTADTSTVIVHSQCAGVPLRNYSLTHSVTWLQRIECNRFLFGESPITTGSLPVCLSVCLSARTPCCVLPTTDSADCRRRRRRRCCCCCCCCCWQLVIASARCPAVATPPRRAARYIPPTCRGSPAGGGGGGGGRTAGSGEGQPVTRHDITTSVTSTRRARWS